MDESNSAQIVKDFNEIKSTVKKNDLPHVALYNKPIPEREMPDLYNACHSFVLISRGEGFCLPMCESGACELPVIASNCTGQTDFLNEDNSFLVNPDGYIQAKSNGNMSKMAKLCHFYEGQIFPDFGENAIEKTREHMRFVYENYDHAKIKAKKLRQSLEKKYTWDMAVNKVYERLRQIKIKAENLFPIFVSDDCPIFSIKSITRNEHIMGFKEGTWIQAKDLIEKKAKVDGHYLVIPRLKGQISSNEISLLKYIKNNRGGFITLGKRLSFPINKETAWALGLFVAEGSTCKNRSDVCVCLNHNEVDLQNKFSKIIRNQNIIDKICIIRRFYIINYSFVRYFFYISNWKKYIILVYPSVIYFFRPVFFFIY